MLGVTHNAMVSGRLVEYEWVGPPAHDRPTLVFLHEGLGSVGQWKRFPNDLCDRLNRRGLVYNRFGYGRSERIDEPRTARYLHHEALDVLPAILSTLDIDRPILVGHSDGGSIALIYAGAGIGPIEALILEAPHIFVEDTTIDGLHRIQDEYGKGQLRDKLAGYHADVDHMFRSWLDVWLDPAFRSWTIEPYLEAISCPVLVFQGREDQYGTPAHIDAIARHVKGRFESHLLANCGHTPHFDQREIVLNAIVAFLDGKAERPRDSPSRMTS
jgi:pimeloyl-ACP methyl ester carboxylesterase